MPYLIYERILVVLEVEIKFILPKIFVFIVQIVYFNTETYFGSDMKIKSDTIRYLISAISVQMNETKKFLILTDGTDR